MRINEKDFFIEVKGGRFHCAMDVTMGFIGGKWKSVLLWYLRKDKKRYNELRKLCPTITERMLSITLKQLEDDGLIQRIVYEHKPPMKVEYSLTEFGQSLIPLLHSIVDWGRKAGKEKGRIVAV